MKPRSQKIPCLAQGQRQTKGAEEHKHHSRRELWSNRPRTLSEMLSSGGSLKPIPPLDRRVEMPLNIEERGVLEHEDHFAGARRFDQRHRGRHRMVVLTSYRCMTR